VVPESRIPQDAEEERLAAVHRLGLLDTAPEERFDRVVRLAQRLFDVQIVAVNLIDEDRQFSKSQVGMTGEDLPRPDSFCARAIESPAQMQVTNAVEDEEWVDNPLVTADGGLRFYAGQPLAAPGGQLVGTLCLADDRPRTMTPQEESLLRDLGAWVEKELASDTERLQAGEVQRRLLPAGAPQLPGYDLAGRCLPARDVGGDFFDWQLVDDRLRIVVADVMGKGIAAAIVAAGVRAVMRATSRRESMAEAVRRVNVSMNDDLTAVSSFVTMFALRLFHHEGRIEYVDAGHGLALVIGSDGKARSLRTSGLPLGLGPDEEWASSHDRLEPGETLVVVSDGILDVFETPEEAIDAAVELCGRGLDTAAMVEEICAAGVAGATTDDITCIVLRRLP
jgi:hypothetical protein